MLRRLLVILVCCAAVVKADAADYYVSKSGNDGNVGSFASPWLTIQKAANTVVAGDTVHIRAGTYQELFSGNPNTGITGLKPQNSGTKFAPIVYQAYDPGSGQVEKVVLDQDSGVIPDGPNWQFNTNSAVGIYIQDKSWLTFRNIEITDVRNAGIQTQTAAETTEFDQPTGIVIEGMHIHGVYGTFGANMASTRLDNCTDCIVRQSTFHTTAFLISGQLETRTGSAQNALCVQSYAGLRVTVRNNIFHDCYSGVFVKKGSGFNTSGTYNPDWVIKGNLMYDMQVGVRLSIQGADDNAHHNVVIRENIFTEFGKTAISSAIAIELNDTATQSDGVTIENNYIRASNFGVSCIGTTNTRIWNNIFEMLASNDTNIREVQVGDFVCDISDSDYNLFFGSQRFEQGARVDTSLADWQTNSGFDTNAQSTDPNLKTNFAPNTGSPAINNGKVGGDAAGTTVDIGAFPNGARSAAPAMVGG